MKTGNTSASALGITVKSGWACVVHLTGPVSRPALSDSSRIDLSDPAEPTSKQPYHDGFGTARAEGPELTRLVASVKRFGGCSVTTAIKHARRKGQSLRGVGIVVGSVIDPARLGSSHVRIHALEGQLFRETVSAAARRSHLQAAIWRERDLKPLATRTLGLTMRQLQVTVGALGQHRGPWRAEHKHAALAAWLVLAGAKAGESRPEQENSRRLRLRNRAAGRRA